MSSKSNKSEHQYRKIFTLTMTFVLLLSIVVLIIPILFPTAKGNVHGVSGASSTMEEDNGPNDANPLTGEVRWDSFPPDHYIEGDYTVNSGYTLTIEAGCNIYFNGSYSIIVAGTLNAVGTSGNLITFTSNNTIPGIGDWSSVDFAGGGGSMEYCNIDYATEGIHIDSSTLITISNNMITNNVYGINGTHPSLALTNNNVSYNSKSGIRMEAPISGLSIQATSNTIMGNMGGEGGITIYSNIGDITATISNNEVNDNIESGIYLYSISGYITATINGNNIEGNGFEGIYIIAEGSTATLDTTIFNNDIIGNYYGIWLTNNWMFPGTDIVYNISRNNILNNGDSIYVDCSGSINGEAWNNNITNNSGNAIYGESLDGDNQYRIIGNTLWKNDSGIYLDYYYMTPANRTLTAEITDNKVIDNRGSSFDIMSEEYLDFVIERNEVYDNYFGLYAYAWRGQLAASIHDNTFDNNDGNGIILNAYETISLNMTNNEVKNSAYDNLYLYTENGGDFHIRNNDFSGSKNWDGVSFDYFNASGRFQDNIVNDNALSGIKFWKSTDITIINTTLNNNLYGVTCNDSTVNITNSSILSSSYDFNLSSDSHVIALNTSFDNSSANFEDPDSNLTVRWFLDVKVEDGGGSGVDNADIWVNDSLGMNEWSGNTGTGNNGWVYLVQATEYVQNYTGMNYTTPHNVSAKKTPEHGYSRPNICKSRDVKVVINSEPVGEDLMPAGSTPGFVYRNETLFINANCSDFKDAEDQLTPFFEYQDPNVSTWNKTYFLGAATYTGSAPSGYWTIPFAPLITAPLGWYDFRVRFNDTMGAKSVSIYANDSVEVINNLPQALDLTNESSTVLRTQSIYLYANGTDIEDFEGLLTPHFQYDDPDSTGWATDYLTNLTYASGRWMVEFTPPFYAKLGAYDFQVRFNDTDGDFSNWLPIYDFVVVLNNPPMTTDISQSAPSVLRTESIFIYANGTDIEDSEGLVTPHFEYNDPNSTGWTSDYLSTAIYTGSEWRVTFTPPFDAKLGTYDFRVRFSDLAIDFGEWVYYNDSVMVNNNPPSMTEIKVISSQIYRTETVVIYAVGYDTEDLPSYIVPTFQYKFTDSSTWNDLPTWSYSSTHDRFEVSFTPSADADVGDYDLRVEIWDYDGGNSGWLYLNESLEVLNNLPSVLDLTLSDSEVFRGNEIFLYATANDADKDLGNLTPIFEYKLEGGDWETAHLGTPEYTNEKWQVKFSPTEEAFIGSYSFQVRFSDGDDLSNWMYKYNALDVKNNLPSVEIDTAGTQESLTVTFSATVSDFEDEMSSLTFEWNFGDGLTSDQRSPTYTYENPGPYTVTLTVTDVNDGEDFDTSQIVVEAEPEVDDETVFPLWILLMLILVIVVVLILVLVLIKRKKPEEKIEVWQPVPAGVLTPPATPAAPPIPIPQVEQPAVAPKPVAAPFIPPPPAPPPPVPAPLETEPMFTRSIRCPKCHKTFQTQLKKGLQTMTCPHCGVKGKISL